MRAAARRCRCARSPASRSSSLGTGEKLDAIEPFHPGRVAGRILGMGDIVSIVEKAAESIEEEDAEKLAKRMAKGSST
jgi:signal recognition particle subunit SRP54